MNALTINSSYSFCCPIFVAPKLTVLDLFWNHLHYIRAAAVFFLFPGAVLLLYLPLKKSHLLINDMFILHPESSERDWDPFVEECEVRFICVITQLLHIGSGSAMNLRLAVHEVFNPVPSTWLLSFLLCYNRCSVFAYVTLPG